LAEKAENVFRDYVEGASVVDLISAQTYPTG
jgi:hypothetical protein